MTSPTGSDATAELVEALAVDVRRVDALLVRVRGGERDSGILGQIADVVAHAADIAIEIVVRERQGKADKS